VKEIQPEKKKKKKKKKKRKKKKKKKRKKRERKEMKPITYVYLIRINCNSENVKGSMSRQYVKKTITWNNCRVLL
jgi:hypothetical protein